MVDTYENTTTHGCYMKCGNIGCSTIVKWYRPNSGLGAFILDAE